MAGKNWRNDPQRQQRNADHAEDELQRTFEDNPEGLGILTRLLEQTARQQGN